MTQMQEALLESFIPDWRERLAAKDQEIEQNRQVIEQNKQELEQNKQELEQKDREIAMLRAQVLSMQGMN